MIAVIDLKMFLDSRSGFRGEKKQEFSLNTRNPYI